MTTAAEGEVEVSSELGAKILQMRGSGATLKYIASQTGYSVEGIRQICIRASLEKELKSSTERILTRRMPPSKVRIDEIVMSARAFRALNTLGIIYLSEVSQFTEREFFSIRGIGRKTLWEIYERVLQPFGLKLKSNG